MSKKKTSRAQLGTALQHVELLDQDVEDLGVVLLAVNLEQIAELCLGRLWVLLGLVTISLTITGFSGPKIAASSTFSKISISYGLVFILVSAVLMLMGPLQLRWGTTAARTRSATL